MRAAPFVVALAACGGTSKPAESPQTSSTTIENKQPAAQPAAAPVEASPSTDPKRVFEVFEQFTRAMCACKDEPCAKQVSDDMTAWSKKMAESQAEPVKMSEADHKRATEIATRMGECMQRAMGAGSGASTP